MRHACRGVVLRMRMRQSKGVLLLGLPHADEHVAHGVCRWSKGPRAWLNGPLLRCARFISFVPPCGAHTLVHA